MAQYDFECEECRKKFTVKQSFAEHELEARPKCPKCNSHKVRQLISAIHVKTAKKS